MGGLKLTKKIALYKKDCSCLKRLRFTKKESQFTKKIAVYLKDCNLLKRLQFTKKIEVYKKD